MTAAAATYGFAQLFSVGFQHAYYNADGGQCRDFKVAPTPACARLMSSLGIIFRDNGAGFAVFIDTGRVGAMASYVRDAYAGGAPAWPHLTFVLNLANPLFIGVTDLPITTSPLQQNLYASNLATTASGGQIFLGPQATLGTDDLLAVTGPGLSVAVPAGCAATLTDLAGRTVGQTSPIGQRQASFDLSRQPYDIYTATFTSPSAAPPPPQQFLYVPPRPVTMCLLNLVLSPPPGSTADTAAFPLPTLPAAGVAPTAAAVQAVDLQLAFAARDTIWQYYVVSPGRRGNLGPDLGITGIDTPATAKLPVKASQVSFARVAQVLPNGDQAQTFTASDALPLLQRSPYVFRLSGHRQGPNGGRDQISVARLPVAPVAPVWPGASGDEMTGRSEMYVYV